ncbi:Vacuolar fusion protein MON1 [Paramyrothecium foliicola]|nr:Vacuolar fusion protein MON1 [Paramyrothecium foliicola]
MAPETASPPDEDRRPPLPPRPSTAASADTKSLQALATTAITPIDIQTLSFPDGSRGTFSSPGPQSASTPVRSGNTTPSRRPSIAEVEGADDAASVMSFAPTMRPVGDMASLLAGELNRRSPAWNLLRSQSATMKPFERPRRRAQDRLADFGSEFDAVPETAGDEFGDENSLAIWKSKLKHYMILSSAGKPIWSRHGDLSLINSSIGVIQTIISFFEGAKNPLHAYTAGDTRFLVAIQGPLYFVAISKLGESDAQLRAQLEALYMQILSTLTLPNLLNIFVHRPSTDLRKPLQGTESLLSSLADNFTKGSASALLGSLECLKLRKSHRASINNTFLKLRTDKLLYGLIVAGGKLVSVIRPRRHSLHPSDLQLIFNMLFESDGIKAGGGENWIPLCLPAFNNQGYLYMYVSFFEGVSGEQATAPAAAQGQSTDEEIAMILISADRESFFDLKQMRDNVAQQLAKNGSLSIIRDASRLGRPKVPDIVPGSQISHFLFKSRPNVQFCMASLKGPAFTDVVDRRRLMSVYHSLHASVHAKNAHLKVLHCIGDECTSLAWVTPIFEFYCIAGPNMSRTAMTQGANKIIQWVKKEEERIFILGGGVF